MENFGRIYLLANHAKGAYQVNPSGYPSQKIDAIEGLVALGIDQYDARGIIDGYVEIIRTNLDTKYLTAYSR